MKPVVFTIPFIGRDVPGYGLMLMIGFLLAIWWAARRAAKSGANPDVVLNCGFIALITGVAGCRAMYVIHYWEQFQARGSFREIVWAVVDITKGGLEFYGGFLLTVIVVLAWLRWREKVSIRWYLDILAPSAALGLAIGRIGCFVNGCCFGSTCDLPWAQRFPFGSSPAMQQWKEKMPGAAVREELLFTYAPGVAQPLTREFLYTSDEKLDAVAEFLRETIGTDTRLEAINDPAVEQRLRARVRELGCSGRGDLRKYHAACTNMNKYGLSAAELQALADEHRSLPVHPTQNYSTITALLIALLLNVLYWRRTRDGQVLCTLFLIEPVSRWMLEVIRADNPTDTLGVFTISQFLAACMTLAGLIGLLALRRMAPRSPRATIWEPPPEASQGKVAKKKLAAGAG